MKVHKSFLLSFEKKLNLFEKRKRYEKKKVKRWLLFGLFLFPIAIMMY